MKKKPSNRILIVEDEALLNEAYKTILQKEGYEVDTAFNGQEAIKKVEKKKPDLILLDLRMPKMNGVEFLEAAQIEKNYPEVKIVVFSNYDVQKEIDKAFKLGASRYMLKAWASPNELVKVVRDMLA